MRHWALVLVVGLICSIGSCMAQAQCGKDAGGAVCPNGLCCSSYGFCGDTPAYCTNGCQSQCTPTPTTPTPTTPTPTTPTPTTPTGGGGGGDLASIVPQSLFDEIFKHKNDPVCEGSFYTYDAFITASKSYGAFASEGNLDERKREVAAFLAQTSHETTGGYDAAPDGRYAWGYCFVREQGGPGDYCEPSKIEWPCAPNQKYFGRGPLQLTGNENYGQAGKGIGEPLLENPDLVASDPVVSFKTAFWFWMTDQPPKPSCHKVILGQWTPSDADKAAGRVGGFGLTTNIINGGVECGKGRMEKVEDRIGFYKRYCELLGVSPGDHLDCDNQMHY